MGIFDFFGKKSAIEKHALRVADKRAQPPDRWDSIQALGKVIAEARPKPGAKPGEGPTPEALERAKLAVEALLPRFGYYVDPSITDQEEKDEVARLICEAGEPAIEPVVRFFRKSESLGWPLKLLDRLVPGERVVAELLAVLDTMDTEYERDPTRKIQVLQALEDRHDPRIAAGVKRFVSDVNETVRFHAVGAIFAQQDAAPAREALADALAREDSVRVRTRMLEGFAARSWDVGAARASVARSLPPGITLDANGVPRLVR